MLARPQRGRSAGGQRHPAALRTLRDGGGVQPGSDRAHGCPAAEPRTVLDGLFLLARTCAQGRCPARQRTLRSHLRALLFGGAVRGEGSRDSQDPRLRRHGFAEVAGIRQLQILSAQHGLLAGGYQARARGKAPRPPLRPVHRHHPCRMGDARILRHRRVVRLVSQWRGRGLLQARWRRLRSGYDQLHRPHGLLPQPGSHVPFLRRGLALAAKPAPRHEAAHRRRRPHSRGAEARRARGHHRDRFGARRTPLHPAFGGDGRATQHCARHAEQDPRSHGDGRASRFQPYRGGRCRCGGGEHLLVADSAQEYAEAIASIIEQPAERDRLARAGRERMLSHHAWPRSMERLDTILDRCLDEFQSKHGATQ